ncbi:MAG: CCA tRNA nucleotidyltransferase [Cyanobacteriota bacterium]|nr:CCA tRNA nucleotidyltransferase [Cyanobacteriota bacterium]
MPLPGLPASLVPLLRRCSGGDRLALVGGAVRDLLLHRQHNDPWRGVPDLDLVVEAAGSAPALPPAHALARRLRAALGPAGVPVCQEHGAFGTVELELRLPEGPLLLDVATARRETYPRPGDNPRVSEGRLDDDLARRDFSINAMALLIGDGAEASSGDGVLLDPHGGQADLQRRELRLLHSRSLSDDPTRIVRAARYAARLGFDLAPASQEQLATTLAAWPWPWRPGDPPEQAPPALGTRLRMELELLLERENWRLALAALQRWGALPLLDPALQGDGRWRQRLAWGERLGLPRLATLLAGATEPLALAARLQLPGRQQRLLAGMAQLQQRLAAAPPVATAAAWTALLERPGPPPAAAALLLASGRGPRRPLLRWWLRWRHLGPATGAAELMAAGLPAGPELGQRLRQLRAERLADERP